MKRVALQMEVENEVVDNLVSLWVERSVGNRASFGYIIGEYLSVVLKGCNYFDLMQFLKKTKIASQKIIEQHSDDIPLRLSHAEFCSALDSFIVTAENLKMESV